MGLLLLFFEISTFNHFWPCCWDCNLLDTFGFNYKLINEKKKSSNYKERFVKLATTLVVGAWILVWE
jgi:hypothetical protein